MATIEGVSEYIAGGVARIIWETLTETDNVGSAEASARAADKTVQAIGTFGGTTLTMQGSNDGSNWFSLTDQSGTAVTLSSAGGALIAENPRFIRPSLSGGTSVDVDVIVIGRT